MPDIDSLRPLRRAFTFRYVADSVGVDQDIRPLLFEESARHDGSSRCSAGHAPMSPGLA